MTDNNPFFRFLWRLNAVLLTALGLSALVVLVYLLAKGWWTHADNFTPKMQSSDAAFTYALIGGDLSLTDGKATVLQGSREAFLVLSRVPRAQISYRTGRAGMSWPVNLLILDIATGKGRWLFNGLDQKLESITDVREHPADNPTDAVKALLISAIDADTNNDGVFSEGDRQSLYLYRPGDARARKLLMADEIVSVTQTDAENIVVVYRNGEAVQDTILSARDFAVRANVALPSNGQ